MGLTCGFCREHGLWKTGNVLGPYTHPLSQLLVPCDVCLFGHGYIWGGNPCYGVRRYNGMYYLLLLEELAWELVDSYSSHFEDPSSDNFGEGNIEEWVALYPEEIQNAVLDCYDLMVTNQEQDYQSEMNTDDESIEVLL